VTQALKLNFNDPPILSGRLRQAAMPAFLEYLSTSQHTGSLECEGPGEVRAAMVVQIGKITHALCELEGGGVIEGIEAVRGMLRWRYAHISLFDGFLQEISPNITSSIMGVLLEAARLEDEMRRERSFPANAKIRVRNNVAAYEALGVPEMTVLRKSRNGMTVQELRRAVNDPTTDSAMQELHTQGILEVEGVPPPAISNTTEFRALLGLIIPIRTDERQTRFGRGGLTPPSGLAKTVLALVDGQRSAEQMRNELRLSRSAIRETLGALRNAGWIDY
jgi:hypothetical protein